jgi:predicted kinase
MTGSAMRTSLFVQMAGHAGSGKSTLARQVADHFGGVVVDLDVVKTALLDAGLGWDQASKGSYETIYALVDDFLAGGTRCVVVDVPSYWPDIHQRLGASVIEHQARYLFLECTAPEAVRVDRVLARPAKRSQIQDLGFAPVDAPRDATMIHLRPIARPPAGPYLIVDTNEPVDVRSICAQIDASATSLG